MKRGTGAEGHGGREVSRGIEGHQGASRGIKRHQEASWGIRQVADVVRTPGFSPGLRAPTTYFAISLLPD